MRIFKYMEIDDGIKLGETFSMLFIFNYPHYSAKNQNMYRDINNKLIFVFPSWIIIFSQWCRLPRSTSCAYNRAISSMGQLLHWDNKTYKEIIDHREKYRPFLYHQVVRGKVIIQTWRSSSCGCSLRLRVRWNSSSPISQSQLIPLSR